MKFPSLFIYHRSGKNHRDIDGKHTSTSEHISYIFVDCIPFVRVECLYDTAQMSKANLWK